MVVEDPVDDLDHEGLIEVAVHGGRRSEHAVPTSRAGGGRGGGPGQPTGAVRP
ncbi:hypothetical protein HGI15_11110 [Modestobacter lapidis]|nr:hypothetical protein [Modestobacter lapidis]